MRPAGQRVIDVHFHVGLLGDGSPRLGALSDHFREQLAYPVFLAYAHVDPATVSDRTLREATERAIDGMSEVDQVVCLALDPVYDARSGARREDLSHMWVDNAYVIELRRTLGEKVLLGASVHPYDPAFERRVREAVDSGAALLKWLPSAQAIDLADPRAGTAMRLLGCIRGDRPLPLLLHCGAEYAIPPSDERLSSYDFLSWSAWERFVNLLRLGARKHTPRLAAVHANLRAALDEGAVIIFAHCGFPYFTSGALGRLLEHDDYGVIRGYLEGNAARGSSEGRCYADISACCTPFRRARFDDVKRLPPEYVLFGSDFPTPIFEISGDPREVRDDLRAVLAGHLERVLIPGGNLLDVNHRELGRFFPGHPLFTNLNRLVS